MGTWGFKAYESDCAADWFGDMHDVTQLRSRVVRTLKAGAKREGVGGVRAAAYVLNKMGRTYMWPVRSLDDDLRLAVKALKDARALICKHHKAQNKRLGKTEKCSQDHERMLNAIDWEIGVLQNRVRVTCPRCGSAEVERTHSGKVFCFECEKLSKK